MEAPLQHLKALLKGRAKHLSSSSACIQNQLEQRSKTDRDFDGNSRSSGGPYLGATIKLNELFNGFGQQRIAPPQSQAETPASTPPSPASPTSLSPPAIPFPGTIPTSAATLLNP
jgi:hypothetical protein